MGISEGSTNIQNVILPMQMDPMDIEIIGVVRVLLVPLMYHSLGFRESIHLACPNIRGEITRIRHRGTEYKIVRMVLIAIIVKTMIIHGLYIDVSKIISFE